MLLACAVAVIAVALGLALGLVPVGRSRIAGPLRTFALSAALTVVLLHLLPEAFSELGPLALALFAATSIVPEWMRLGRTFFGARHDHAGAHGGLVAGYVGLLVHHVGDGLGLGAYAALPGGAEDHADVMLALAVHTVPLVAVVAFAFQRNGGQRAALRAAAGLAGASVVGVLLSSVVPEALVERSAAWIAALVAGLLVHVVTHDLERDLPENFSARVLDASAAVLGVATTVLGDEHSVDHSLTTFATIAADTLGKLSIPVVAGLVLAALVAKAKSFPFRAPLGAAFGASFAVDALVLALWIGGAAWGAIYAAGVVLVASAVRVSSPREEDAISPPPSPPALPFIVHLDDWVSQALPWILCAFAFCTLMASSFPGRALEVLPPAVALALAVMVALPIRVPAAAALLVAAALEHAGLRFEAALAFALVAAAPGAEELTQLARRKSPKVAVRLALAIQLSALVLGALAWSVRTLLEPYAPPPFPGSSAQLAFLVLVVLGVRAAFDQGLRGFLLHVFPSHDTASHADSSEHSSATLKSSVSSAG